MTARSPVRVEPMTSADVVAVLGVDGGDATEPSLRAELQRSWCRAWVARAEDAGHGPRVVGFLVAWHVADELHILNVATDAAYRRHGVGRILLNEALAYARSVCIVRLLLEVRRSNGAALALYRGAGFYASGVRARYYADDEDAVEMVLTLDAATGATIPHMDEVKLDG